ncbi:MarR family winged helix-turn-helix transcriptional regulator [Paenibacillus lentus]|uniref:MarR family transcriptional regulator n=1 Tax=Paenibacillus lentus TaxID=1338368 RepID=A0A3Q8S4E5_9BACL|nr:MarR family transcriptional regulator [Paenibacillus lentus]AZK46121.1 MarR family transcriptional regulator [Paenibacillus lentus]
MGKERKNEEQYKRQDERLGLLIWFRLSRIYNQSLRASNQYLKAWDLTVAQFDCLVQIGSHEGLTQQELADKLFVTKGNITQLLSKMEQLGWITRQQTWKTKHLYLSEQGRKLFDEVVPKQEHYQASHFDTLNLEEKKQLIALLRKVESASLEQEKDKS